MRLGWTILWLATVLSACTTALAQAPSDPGSDEELKAHRESIERRLEDITVDLAVRERLAREMAATLDRSAQAGMTPEIRRRRWTEAVEILDRFHKNEPNQAEGVAFKTQAAVYVWARARDRLRAWQLDPTDLADRKGAEADLEDCVERLKSLYQTAGQGDDVLAQNLRFRYAQALADLADVQSGAGEDAEKKRFDTNNEVLAVLLKPIPEASLSGFVHALRATVLNRQGRFDEALKELDAAAAAKPAPGEDELVASRAEALAGKKDFAGALKAIDGSKLDTNEKAVLRARTRIAEYTATPAGAGREPVEVALFEELKAIRAANRADSRATLAAAARAIMEPGESRAAEAWDVLADGALALGDAARAGQLASKAAAKAEVAKQPAQAVAYRLKAGAFYFQGEKFAEADPILGKVAEDRDAGKARPRAALLRALGRGRALAAGIAGVSTTDYTKALRYVIDTFPEDTAAGEARWLLGKLRLAEADREGALTLWEAIPRSSPRWLESRVEIAALRQGEIERQRLNNDRGAVERKFSDARGFLARAVSQAQGDAQTFDLLLASARLELTPGLGRSEEARKTLEQLQRMVARPDQRDAARRLSLVALVAQNRWTDAESVARQELTLSEPLALMPTVRLLDRWAAESDSDLRERRIGYILRLMLTGMSERARGIPEELKPEMRLRFSRALLFSGDDSSARRALTNGFNPSGTISDELLRDLAEVYTRLEVYELAIDVQRLRARKAATGSIPWFDARYGLALAYFRAGKGTEALHLIDGTSILHPDLGGGELRDKFLRLRQRIQPN